MDIRGTIDRSDRTPVYRQIASCLRESILSQSSEWQDGQDPAIPTERELSTRFGVQRPTVRKAIAELLAERLLYRIRGTGTFVNTAALAAGRKQIEIVTAGGALQGATNPFSWFLCYDMLRGATAGADELGCHCHLLDTVTQSSNADSPLDTLTPDTCLGVIFFGYTGHERIIQRLQTAGIACVVADGMKKDMHLNRVFTDREKGIGLAVEHLLQLGHRRIALLNGSLTEPYFQERYNGYELALRLNGIVPDPALVVECDGHPMDGAAAMSRLLAERSDVTAVVAATDLRAVGAMEAIRTAGRRIPEDISVVGYHDSKSAGEQDPQLTTIRLPAYEMGRQAVLLLRALLVRDVSTPTGREVPAELVVRESTGKAPVSPHERCHAHGVGGLTTVKVTMGTITLGTTPLVRISYPTNAPGPVQLAADELRNYLRISLGVILETGEGVAEPGVFFVTTAQLNPDAFAAAGPFPADEYDRCAAFGRNGCVFLVGENPLSAQYAVYDFLQAYLGIRFFAPGREHEYVPTRSVLRLTEEFVFRRGSRFAIRNWVNRTNDPEVIRFAIKSRINTVLGCGPWNPSLGSDLCNAEDAELVRAHGLMLRGPGHAWRRFIPHESLFATHPEYFPVVNGRRTVNGRTACFSNPSVRDIFRENLRRFLREHPYWDVFAFWAEDVPDSCYCACDECRKLTLTDWYIILANEAAEVVAEELPDAVFELIAYQGTRIPPQHVKSLFRKGATMLVNFCLGSTRDLYRPLASRTHGSAEVYARYREWRDYLAEAGYQGRIMVMEYYNLCEMPNQGPNGRALLWPMDTIMEDTRFYRQDGVDSLGAFTGFDRLCWPSPFNIWCWLKLWSDPDLSVEALVDDFYPAYFGAAGPAIREYMDQLQHAMLAITCPENVATVRALGRKLDAIPGLFFSQFENPESGSGSPRPRGTAARDDPHHCPEKCQYREKGIAPDTIQPDWDDTQLAERLKRVRLHHEYCVLLKELFCAYLEDKPATWQALEEPYVTFFERHHRDLQENMTPFPPLWGATWVRNCIRTGFKRVKLPRDQFLDMLR